MTWILAIALLCMGYAHHRDVSLDSTPQGAVVSIRNSGAAASESPRLLGTTPLSARLPPHALLDVRLAGFEPDLWIVEPGAAHYRFRLVPLASNLTRDATLGEVLRDEAWRQLEAYMLLRPSSEAYRSLASRTRAFVASIVQSTQLRQMLAVLAARADRLADAMERGEPLDLTWACALDLIALAWRIAAALGYHEVPH